MSVLGQFQRGVVGDFCGFDQGRRRLSFTRQCVSRMSWLLERIVQSLFINLV